jgi:hypothetical protein
VTTSAESDVKVGTVGPLEVWSRLAGGSDGVVYVLHSSLPVTGTPGQGVRVEIVLTSGEFAALAGLIRHEQGFRS